ncbi:Six-hairpin glycosidase-like protein [Dactylonectria macrodidyma]|uniref:Six-hairpin glycosidase-like protein n=1 Tax=Dactylonectria macrodidyma TaxID=307937 RepID=A0A9P9DHT1_9HYPO|nr:Six-hairpin glycosidase-like protein [Dactylonectria macrodidyma]
MYLLVNGNTWIWHPAWVDTDPKFAGGFLHFRKTVHLDSAPTTPLEVNISADTRFKLYINKRLVHWGPVKGDANRWFYDTVDIAPFLQQGENHVAVHVLRFYHASTYASSFARMPIGGLFIRTIDRDSQIQLNTDDTWETAIDPSTVLRADDPSDLFMHIFEQVDKRNDAALSWVEASIVHVAFEPEGAGITMPWRLCPRMIPRQRQTALHFCAVHNVRSTVDQKAWEALLLPHAASKATPGVRLPAGTSHHIELEVESHKTTLLAFRFAAEASATGSKITITYSECYEDDPIHLPFTRAKGDRTDTTKKLIGPHDSYILSGKASPSSPLYHINTPQEEVYQPYHYRTFRYLAIDIEVPENSEAICRGIDVIETRYPLDVKGSFETGDDWVSKLWSISVRTLENCMHDCYEDCPFYEQLQYPMDTRSSSLFTYLIAGDDRLARQAIIQLHDTFSPSIGLTESRSAANFMQRQYIVAFALYWICMVVDHYEYHADATFVRQFLGVAESIIQTFASRIDPEHGLVTSSQNAAWEYTDWTTPWAPMGVPSAVRRTGVSTYTNCLFAYTLEKLAGLHNHLGRKESALEFRLQAERIVKAVSVHCFDGEFFTDGLAQAPVPVDEYSQHCQAWAVLCGVATGELADKVVRVSLAQGNPMSQTRPLLSASEARANLAKLDRRLFTMTSISFSFYTLRALAAVSDSCYDEHFHAFWSIWKEQAAQNVTTWAEDAVNIRSDCHAWGSVPIHEFMTEVAGIKPAEPGWTTVGFQPRLRLFPNMKTSLPINRKSGSCMLEVEWEGQGESTVFTVELHDSLEYLVSKAQMDSGVD